MHFLNCYHPVKIKKYGFEHWVPCGKCDYCKYVRNQSMSQRLGVEMKSHKYNVFVTLTYSDTFIPKYIYSPGLNALIKDSDNFLHGAEDSGVFIDTTDFSNSDMNHVRKMHNQLGFLPVLDRKDVQNFIKRLRRYIDYNLVQVLLRHGKITEAQKSEFGIYYSFCGEYGPSNYRPHLHGIISFEKKEMALMFHRLLHKAWTYGRVTYKYTSSPKHAKYISEYVNATYRLPKFYQRQEIRPFRLFSKSHPVGFPALSEEEISRVFHKCSSTMVYEDAEGKSRTVPLWSCVENKLFPRFIAYNQIDDSLRLEILKDAISYDKFTDFVNSKSCYNDLPFQPSDYCIKFHTPLHDYYTLINKELQGVSEKSRLFNSALYSIFHAASIIKSNMLKYKVPDIKTYLSKINQYLFNVAQYRLKMQFEFEQTWYYNHPDWLKYINIGGFNIDDILRDTTDMHEIYSQIRFSIENSHKNRKKTDFKASNSFRNPDMYVTSIAFSGLDNY